MCVCMYVFRLWIDVGAFIVIIRISSIYRQRAVALILVVSVSFYPNQGIDLETPFLYFFCGGFKTQNTKHKKLNSLPLALTEIHRHRQQTQTHHTQLSSPPPFSFLSFLFLYQSNGLPWSCVVGCVNNRRGLGYSVYISFSVYLSIFDLLSSISSFVGRVWYMVYGVSYVVCRNRYKLSSSLALSLSLSLEQLITPPPVCRCVCVRSMM